MLVTGKWFMQRSARNETMKASRMEPQRERNHSSLGWDNATEVSGCLTKVHSKNWRMYLKFKPEYCVSIIRSMACMLTGRTPTYKQWRRILRTLSSVCQSLKWILIKLPENLCTAISKFLQHSIARARTVSSNQIAEGYEFCSLIGSQGCRCFNGKLQELGKRQ